MRLIDQLVDFLTGSDQMEGRPRVSRMETRDMLKQATAYKREGNMSAAVDMLRRANRSADSDAVDYGVKTYLRLPLYLQQAGRYDEAMQEFDKLLNAGPPRRTAPRTVRPMEDSQIYDKMRLAMQREGRVREAVKMGVFAKLMWIKGLAVQGRKEELETSKSADSLRATFKSLLKKAKETERLDELVSEMLQEVNTPRKIDLGRAGKKVDAVMQQ